MVSIHPLVSLIIHDPDSSTQDLRIRLHLRLYGYGVMYRHGQDVWDRNVLDQAFQSLWNERELCLASCEGGVHEFGIHQFVTRCEFILGVRRIMVHADLLKNNHGSSLHGVG
jgi:hypothetical protein